MIVFRSGQFIALKDQKVQRSNFTSKQVHIRSVNHDFAYSWYIITYIPTDSEILDAQPLKVIKDCLFMREARKIRGGQQHESRTFNKEKNY